MSIRLRWWLTLVVVLLATAGGAVIAVLGSRNLERLALVDARLRDVGQFAGARARLQRQSFELLPRTLSGDAVLVQDVRLQLLQADQLGDRLPPAVRTALGELGAALQRPLVGREALVASAALLERIVQAEAEAQEQIFADARSDIRRERTLIYGGLVLITLLLVAALWVAPRTASGPLRLLARAWLRGVLDQRRTLLRAERLALAGEAAASLAHEMRNPLAGIVLGLQNLERDAPDPLASRVRPLVAEIERVNRSLNEHLGALRAPVESPEPVDVHRTVAELAELLRYEAADRIAIETEVPQGTVCRIQPDRFRQVVLNLGLNAIQAMEGEGGRLRIRAAANEGTLELEVRDTGPGFPPALLEATPAPFTTTRAQGTGLGLRLVRRTVTEMGGTVELSNPPEGGARVLVRIPCPSEAA